MIRKESAVALVLLVSLPGCWRNRRTESAPSHSRTSGHGGNEEFAMVDMPLSDEELAQADGEESVKSFFDEDMNELVATAEDMDDKQAKENEAFAWIETSPDEDKEFETVYFNFDGRAPEEGQGEKLAINIEKAKELLEEAQAESKQAKLVVEGHACHSAGSGTYNLAISEDRAKRITDNLVCQGIPRDAIKVVGRGKEMPAVYEGKAVTGDRKEQWRNRRVEMNVIYS